jgi:hypothetical protein
MPQFTSNQDVDLGLDSKGKIELPIIHLVILELGNTVSYQIMDQTSDI